VLGGGGKKTPKALRHKFGPSGPCDKGSEWVDNKGSWDAAGREKKERAEVGRLGQNRLDVHLIPGSLYKNDQNYFLLRIIYRI
jgi:hypothetical protein